MKFSQTPEHTPCRSVGEWSAARRLKTPVIEATRHLPNITNTGRPELTYHRGQRRNRHVEMPATVATNVDVLLWFFRMDKHRAPLSLSIGQGPSSFQLTTDSLRLSLSALTGSPPSIANVKHVGTLVDLSVLWEGWEPLPVYAPLAGVLSHVQGHAEDPPNPPNPSCLLKLNTAPAQIAVRFFE
jgi:hypothetical protein